MNNLAELEALFAEHGYADFKWVKKAISRIDGGGCLLNSQAIWLSDPSSV
jgi:hypothetical protein